MTELLALPDVEAALVGYLSGVLPGVRVATEEPDPLTLPLLTASLSGGGAPNLIQRTPQLIVQGWAASKGDAFVLTREAQAHVGSLPGQTVGGVSVYRVEDSGPVWLPDPDTRIPRYQFLAAMTVRVDVL